MCLVASRHLPIAGQGRGVSRVACARQGHASSPVLAVPWPSPQRAAAARAFACASASSNNPNSLSDEEIKPLLEQAIGAKEQSYSPYSKFRVGAVVRTADGKVYKGCNVENASYGLSICAERTALTKAVSEGDQKFTTVVVATDVADSWLPPCGACRQFIVEFGTDIEVVLVKPDRSFKRFTSLELLPGAFVPADLEADRV